MGKLATYYIVGGCSCLVVSWLLIIFLPFGWHFKMSPFIEWQAGLLTMYMRAPSSTFFKAVWSTLSGVSGCPDESEHYQSLASFKECWCNFEQLKTAVLPFQKKEMCGQLSRFFVSSTVMLMLGLVCCVCLVIACACMMHYWSGQARRKLRLVIRVSLIIGATAVTVGLTQYTVLNWDSLAEFGSPVGDILKLIPLIPGVSQEPRMTFGYSWMFAVLLVLLTWAPLLFSEHFGKAEMLEEIQEVVHAERKEQMWEEIESMQAGGEAWQPPHQQYGALPPSQFQGSVVYDAPRSFHDPNRGPPEPQPPANWGVGPPPGAYRG